MKNTVTTFQAMKDKGEKISMLTAYDYSTAKLEDAAGINGILVGDSLGNVVLGYYNPSNSRRYDSSWSCCCKRSKEFFSSSRYAFPFLSDFCL